MTSTARVAIGSLREKGLKAGLLKMKAFRPFPTEEVREVLKDVPKVARARPEHLPRQGGHLVPGIEGRPLSAQRPPRW